MRGSDSGFSSSQARTAGSQRRRGGTAWPVPGARGRQRPPRRWAVAPAPEGPGWLRLGPPGAD